MKMVLIIMVFAFFSSCTQEKTSWKMAEVKLQEFFPISGVAPVSERTVLINTKTGEIFLLSAVFKSDGDEDFKLIPGERQQQ